MSTKFFTNESGNSLFKKFSGVFEHFANIHAVHAVIDYFHASGYFHIRAHLVKAPEVKILVGTNISKISAGTRKRGLLFFGDPERTRDEFVKWLRKDILHARYDKDIEKGIILFMQDILDAKILIKVHKTKNLQAKIYIFLPEKFNEYSGGEVITGSSNLTEAGLSINNDNNYEFNVALKDFADVSFAEREFQKLWAEGEAILPLDIERTINSTHIGQLYTPFEIYIKFLIEFFGKGIDYDPDSVGDLPKHFKKLSYQVEAVNQGYQMLEQHNGFMLADVVGLGKTVIATMTAKRFLITNGTLNTKMLVVYPPHLERNWKSTFRQFGIDKHTRFVSNGSLHKILEGINEDYWPKEDYDLILVDEAHKFRNHKSKMFNDLQIICKSNRSVEGGIKGLRKKVMLISATPLNNRPEDIYYQLQLFTDARKSTLSVTNLQAFFAPLIRKYKEIVAASRLSDKPDTEQIRKIYTQIREKILLPITVRRTRKDVESYKDYKKDLEDQGISFPDIAAPRSIEYKMNNDLESLFYDTIGLLVNDIGYYRYRAIEFLDEEIQDLYYSQAQRASRTLAHIMMTQMVKRLESSFYAFKITLNRFRVSTARMIQMFENNKVYVAPDANINEMLDKGWDEEDIDAYIMELSEDNPRNQIFTTENFAKEFIEKLKEDFGFLQQICNKWELIHEDPKWDVFLKLLNNELLRKDINPTGKLVIFSESKETVHYLQNKLRAEGFSKILTVSADNRKSMHDTILQNFDANYTGEPAHDIDFIISTEVLAEGINLHRANMLINYDTPWNATKLMQRIGRVNRIGSLHVIYNYAFYPSRQSDDLINLYNNAFIKLQGFHSAYGEDSKIYTPEEVLEQVKLHEKGLPEDEDKRLKYLEFIRNFKNQNEKEFKRIARMPLRARTARDPLRAKKTGVKASSLVFLKSDYKMEFYKIAPNHTEPLSFLEAAGLFEAAVSEIAEQLPDYHHEQVYRAVKKFEEELLMQNTETVSGEQADALTNRSKKFLREQRSGQTDDKFRQACERLLKLLDQGTFTNLATEINKIRLKLDKGQLTDAKANNLVLSMAVKFADLPSEEDAEAFASELPIEILDEPNIIISETFTP
ncbi:MAG: helicase-related protein [Dyadobacter sp.]